MRKTIYDHVHKLYEEEYIHLPNKSDRQSIVNLRKHSHQIDGIFGSSDLCICLRVLAPKDGGFSSKENRK